MFYCDCGNEITNKDLEYIIPKGSSEDDMYADDFEIEVYVCGECGCKIYA